MIPRNKLHLPWSDYQNIYDHMHTLKERSALSAKLTGWVKSAQDYAADTWGMSRGHSKLSDLSAGLASRLELWAILPSCEYVRGMQRLTVRLTFVTENVVAPKYNYLDDLNLMVHVGLQLAPAFDIINRYLKLKEASSCTIAALELRRPTMQQDVEQYWWEYHRHHKTVAGIDERVGMPYAMSVFLTYDSFDF